MAEVRRGKGRRWGGAGRRAWGGGLLVMPHSIAVDPATGHVWITDVALHQACTQLPITSSFIRMCVSVYL